MQKLSVLLYLKLKVQCFEEACLAGYITQQAALPSHSSRSTTRSTLLDCTYMFSMPVPTSRPLPHAILPCTPLPCFLSVFNTILSLGSLSCFLSPCTCTVPVLCTYVPLYTYCTCTVYVCMYVPLYAHVRMSSPPTLNSSVSPRLMSGFARA